MKTVIVEKVVINLKGKHTEFAVACPSRNSLTTRYSLAYEAYITPWGNRKDYGMHSQYYHS